MTKERSLDEALEYCDKWGERVSKALEGLTPEQVVEYFKGSRRRLERASGKKLRLRKDTRKPAKSVCR